MSFQVQWETVCEKCDHVIGAGEFADAVPGGHRHVRCPKFEAKTCPDCFCQHAGKCG